MSDPFFLKAPTKPPLPPPELPLAPFLWWIAAIVVWAMVGWLAHRYMLYDIKKRRLLNPEDHNLALTCVLVAPFAALIAFLMFLTPDERKEGL